MEGIAKSPRGISSPSTPVVPFLGAEEEREGDVLKMYAIIHGIHALIFTVEPSDSNHLIHAAASYEPFASKLLAMAYLIVHSPCPMVCLYIPASVVYIIYHLYTQGHTNLKLVLHTLRAICPEVPRLSCLLKYRLPGHSSLKMVTVSR